jgi:geranylgeranyl transferase type-2 subunit alpha
MLRGNLDFYTIWNYRREILGSWFQAWSAEDITRLLSNEIKFTQECLLKHPKSYWVWSHRKWCYDQLPKADWESELAIVSKMLDLDIRNCMHFLWTRHLIYST